MERKLIGDSRDLNKDWILYENPYIYDGWCAAVNRKTKEIFLRDAWFIKRMSQERQDELEAEIKQNMGW